MVLTANDILVGRCSGLAANRRLADRTEVASQCGRSFLSGPRYGDGLWAFLQEAAGSLCGRIADGRHARPARASRRSIVGLSDDWLLCT
jgi:hypothetical protein